MKIILTCVGLLISVALLRFPPIAVTAFLVIVVTEMALILGYFQTGVCSRWFTWRVTHQSTARKLCLILMALCILTAAHYVSLAMLVLIVLWVGWVGPFTFRELITLE